MSSPELSVVCKSCGSEVSPYVTECPYCGHRIRKRAPRLEREGDEIRVHESRRERRRREKRERQPLLRPLDLDARPLATIATLLVAGILVVVQRAVPLRPEQAGAIVGPVGGEIWRYLTAPFVYVDLGALIVIGAAIAIFGSAVERRLGTVATATVILATGTLGMLAADGIAAAGLDDFLVAGGGNAVALGLLGAWMMLWRAEGAGGLREPLDSLGVIVAAVVLLLIPLFEVTADPIANVAGGLVGVAMGWLAGRRLGAAPG